MRRIAVLFLRLKRPLSLPPSLSDEAPILFPRTSEQKEDSEEYIEELEEEEERERAESAENSEELEGLELPGIMLSFYCYCDLKFRKKRNESFSFIVVR